MRTQVGELLSDVKSGIILQQVNAQGVMGSGIAKAIRDKWPVVWEEYSKVVGPSYTQRDSGLHLLGTIIPVEVEKDLWVINIVGQQFFGRAAGTRYTSYDALDKGLRAVQQWMDPMPFTFSEIHHPLIGSGLGGAKWNIVRAIIEEHLGEDTTLWLRPGDPAP